MEVLAKASGKAERTDNCNYARKQFFPREEIKTEAMTGTP